MATVSKLYVVWSVREVAVNTGGASRDVWPLAPLRSGVGFTGEVPAAGRACTPHVPRRYSFGESKNKNINVVADLMYKLTEKLRIRKWNRLGDPKQERRECAQCICCAQQRGGELESGAPTVPLPSCTGACSLNNIRSFE